MYSSAVHDKYGLTIHNIKAADELSKNARLKIKSLNARLVLC